MNEITRPKCCCRLQRSEQTKWETCANKNIRQREKVSNSETNRNENLRELWNIAMEMRNLAKRALVQNSKLRNCERWEIFHSTHAKTSMKSVKLVFCLKRKFINRIWSRWMIRWKCVKKKVIQIHIRHQMFGIFSWKQINCRKLKFFSFYIFKTFLFSTGKR